MFDAFSKPRNRLWTLIFFAICGASALAAAALGIDDNPPGILCAFLAITAFVLAFVHSWRTARQFMRLLFASILGLVVFGLLHVMYSVLLGENFGGSGFLHVLFSIGAAIFLLTVLLCPSGLLIGAVGAVVMSIRNRQRSTP